MLARKKIGLTSYSDADAVRYKLQKATNVGSMKRLTLLIFLVASALVPLRLTAQNKLELGLFAGGAYYMGDLNMNQQFSNTRPAVGAMARYVFTDRLALRCGVTAAQLAGKYPSGGNKYPNRAENGVAVGNTKYEFERNIADIAIMGEVNFMSYDHMFHKDTRFTPYLTLGVAATAYTRYTDKSDGEMVFVLSLPFGAGAKYKVNKWLRLGVEWTMRKTFVDDLDVVGNTSAISPSDPYGFGDNTLTHNNDWYSFAGVTVSLSMWPRSLRCNDGIKKYSYR